MKSIIKNFFIQSINSILYIYRTIRNRLFRGIISQDGKGVCYILANGPSLNEDLPFLVKNEDFAPSSCFVMNFFLFNQSFFEIKPKHYCLADPILFKSKEELGTIAPHFVEDIKKLHYILNEKVDWSLTIYIPNRLFPDMKRNFKITNHNISIIRVNDIPYQGYKFLTYPLYKMGLAAPPFQTVANMALYIGVMKKYSQIKIYGLDHSFFEDLYINSDSELCSFDKHFYDIDKNIKPIPMLKEDGSQYKISQFIQDVCYMFKAHDILEEFARHLNVEIVNCTRNTLVDSYKRIQY